MPRAMAGPLRLVRAAANTVLFPLWTMLSIFVAGCAGYVLRDPRLFHRWQRHWAKGALGICGIELVITGQENMQPGRGYVVVANHLSHIDTPAIFSALPLTPKFLAKRELWKIPFLGAALRLGGHIRVDRESRRAAVESIQSAAAHVRDGATVLLFPEGTRSDSGTVGKFKSGAFHLAKAAGAPILPVGITGTRGVLPKHGRLVRSGKVHIRIGAPIEPSEVAASDVKTLGQRARDAVAELAGASAD